MSEKNSKVRFEPDTKIIEKSKKRCSIKIDNSRKTEDVYVVAKNEGYYKKLIVELMESVTDEDGVFLNQIVTLLRLHIERTNKK